jgi:predicted nuclease of predicted toxin-antitoxin system
MKILIDECAPKALQAAIAAGGHDCTTVQDAGWSGKENGELLALAGGRFDVLVTLDRKLRYQQNLTGRRIGVVVLRSRSNRLADLQPHFVACIAALVRLSRAWLSKCVRLSKIGRPMDSPSSRDTFRLRTRLLNDSFRKCMA